MVFSFTTVIVTNHEGYLILEIVLYFINSFYLCGVMASGLASVPLHTGGV